MNKYFNDYMKWQQAMLFCLSPLPADNAFTFAKYSSNTQSLTRQLIHHLLNLSLFSSWIAPYAAAVTMARGNLQSVGGCQATTRLFSTRKFGRKIRAGRRCVLLGRMGSTG